MSVEVAENWIESVVLRIMGGHLLRGRRHLSLDIRIQQVVDRAMEGETGSVVVMNPKTGDLLTDRTMWPVAGRFLWMARRCGHQM